jgi:probable phosphoglycerate mutase
MFYVVRHGQTVFNVTENVQGFSDSPLTQEGLEQSKRVGKNMKDIKFISAWSGDAKRQQITIKNIMADNHVAHTYSIPELREWNFGGFETGKNAYMWEKILKKQGIKLGADENVHESFRKWIMAVGDRAFADGIYDADETKKAEKYDDILLRVKTAMDKITTTSLGICKEQNISTGNVLVVSSGCFIRTILLASVPDERFGRDIFNCSVSILRYFDGKFSLKTANDLSFLR